MMINNSELKKLSHHSSTKIKFHDHYQNNISIFRKNFHLIVDILVDDIWEKLSD